MFVLSPDETDRIVAVLNDILMTSGPTVGEIKKKHHLKSEEYDTIFELAMPFIRQGYQGNYWRGMYQNLRYKLWAMTEDEDPKLRKRIRDLLNWKKPPMPNPEDLMEMEENANDAKNL